LRTNFSSYVTQAHWADQLAVLAAGNERSAERFQKEIAVREGDLPRHLTNRILQPGAKLALEWLKISKLRHARLRRAEQFPAEIAWRAPNCTRLFCTRLQATEVAVFKTLRSRQRMPA
jgi:hypothetical protein